MNSKTIHQKSTNNTYATPPSKLSSFFQGGVPEGGGGHEGRGEASTRTYVTPPLAFGEGPGERFPGFPHPASELIEFLCGIDFVVVATTKKLVVRHNATDTGPFRQWLTSHGIPDITDQAGKAILEIYTHKIK